MCISIKEFLFFIKKDVYSKKKSINYNSWLHIQLLFLHFQIMNRPIFNFWHTINMHKGYAYQIFNSCYYIQDLQIVKNASILCSSKMQVFNVVIVMSTKAFVCCLITTFFVFVGFLIFLYYIAILKALQTWSHNYTFSYF